MRLGCVPISSEGFAVTTAAAARSFFLSPTSSPTSGPADRRGTFSALRVRNFRIYLAGHAVASTGTWMRSIAQDWLVLELTGSPWAVGVTIALQFLPLLPFGLYGGMVADRYAKRMILLATQSINALLTAGLAVLTLTGNVRVEYVYLFALVGGLVFVVDNPTRQVFVNEVVPTRHVRNAVALTAAVFQTTRLLGPAVAAVLIGTVGIGWAFAANAACYLGPTLGLILIRGADLVPAPQVSRAPGQLRSALRHVAQRPHVAWTIVLVGAIGMFGLNFPVVLSAMARDVFTGGADLYGLFNVVLAVGSVAGALLAGRAGRPRLRLIIATAALFGVAEFGAALAPGLPLFLAVLVAMGLVNLAFQAMANSSVQMWVDPALRGRVMGLYMLAFAGSSPIGSPLIGWITTVGGPRVGMAVCGGVPVLVAVVVAVLGRRGRAVVEPAVGGARRDESVRALA